MQPAPLLRGDPLHDAVLDDVLERGGRGSWCGGDSQLRGVGGRREDYRNGGAGVDGGDVMRGVIN